jgi:hypothetical protein
MAKKATAREASDDTDTTEDIAATASTATEKKVCPVPRDPTLGDRTPAVIEWYRENDPEEYQRRYVARGRVPQSA